MESADPVREIDELASLTRGHSPIGVAVISSSGEILTAHTAFRDMLGYDPDEITELNFRATGHPDDLLDDPAAAEAAAAEEARDLSVALLRAEDGVPVQFVSRLADHTECRAVAARLAAAEAAVEAAQLKADAVFRSVAVGLLLLDVDGSFQTLNRHHQQFLDMAFPDGPSGAAGQRGFVYDADETRLLSREERPSVRASAGEEFDDVLVWIGEDPWTRRALSVSARSIRDRDGVLTGAAMAYHDVTEMVRAVRAKDAFIQSVSHELRTPLTAVLAYLELLEGNVEASDNIREQVTAARRNALRLSHMVADLLFAARASSGSPLVAPYRVDLALEVAEAVTTAQSHATVAGVSLDVDVPTSLHAQVDGLRLRQVVDNLVAHAIAHTHRGGRVRVTLTEGDGQLELTVADNGEGMDAADARDIFSRFARGDDVRRRQLPGVGLGLDIVRTIVRAHGGEVSAESTPGEGTRVRVVLPR